MYTVSKRLSLAVIRMSMCLLFCNVCLAQDKIHSTDSIINFPSAYFSKIQNKYQNVEDQVTKKTKKYLQKLFSREKKMQRKLAKIDSTGAKQLFANSEKEYNQLISKVRLASTKQPGKSSGYIPMLDSVSTGLSFLGRNSSLLSQSKEAQEKLISSLSQVNQLQGKLQQAEQVKAFILQRKQQLKESLSKYTNLPKGITNEFNNYQKQAWYYNAQLKEYKEMLNYPDRIIHKGMVLLDKLPAFTRFMKHNSELASLFRLPDNYGTPQGLAGLQTRSQVQQQVLTQLTGTGAASNAQQYLQNNLQMAQSQLNQLKDKINKAGGSSSSDDVPDFKPNNQKTKTFWQRLEYGTNIQTAKNNFFPVTSDLGVSVGYRLTDKSVVGVGASYKLGLGQNIKHIEVTSQGMGLRSYLDLKLKGSFFASGGLEYNYQPVNTDSLSATSGAHWKDISSWNQSGLIGVSKIISIKSKFFKKTKLQLMWDFLSYQQVPRTQPVKFRMGYNF